MVPAMAQEEISSFSPAPFSPSSSSTIASLAEKLRALIPMMSEAKRATAPLTMGNLTTGYRSERGTASSFLTTISPEGLLTAIATERGARIMTPSMTAWPPMLIFSI